MGRTKNDNKNLQDKFFDLGSKVAFAGVAFLLAKKLLNKAHEKNTELSVEKNPSVKQAMVLRSGMNPSGFSTLFKTDGTDEEALFDVARQIGNFKGVQLAYSALYKGDSLLRDLQEELSIEDYNKFLSLIPKQSSKKPASGKSNVNPVAASTTGFKYLKVGTALYASNANGTNGYVFEKPDVKPKTLYTQYKRGGLLGKMTRRHVLKILRNGQEIFDRWYQVDNIPGQPKSKLGYVREADVK